MSKAKESKIGFWNILDIFLKLRIRMSARVRSSTLYAEGSLNRIWSDWNSRVEIGYTVRVTMKVNVGKGRILFAIFRNGVSTQKDNRF